MSTSPLTLEDRVFGVRDAEPPIKEHTVFTNPSSILVPVMATVFLSVMISWSLHRSMDYSEMLLANPRYRYALIGGNCAAAALAVATVVWMAGGTPYS